ncbi:MAG: site-specific integrase, partial [Myxococcales bacterium]|nr:site-specific integrase [Myxococcales bacterium]
HVQALKRRELAAITVNKTLRQLRSILSIAAQWGVIDKPLKFKGVKQPDVHPKFYDFAEYRLLTRAARSLSPEILAAVRLGGDAGLRCGELLGLRWPNVCFERRKLYICDNLVRARDKHGAWVMRQPKGGRARWVPISAPLEKALKALARRGAHVLTTKRGRHFSPNGLTRRLATAQRRAGLEPCGPHILRHTFCSQLVLRGVHVRTIQKLAGHANLSTTEVYMHLVTEAEEDAIRRLRDDETDE